MKIQKLIILVGTGLLITSCSGNKFTDGMYGFRSPASTSDLGVQYLLGRGVPQNNKKAFFYFRKAADQGDAFAQNEVAYMYAAGKGTKRDYEKAFMYYQQAASHGLASAQYSLGLMYMRGLGTQKNKRKGLAWFEKSAEFGFEPAKAALKRNRA